MKMNTWLLGVTLPFFVLACGAPCDDSGLFNDVTRAHMFDAEDNDGQKVINVKAFERREDGVNYITRFEVKRLTTGEDIQILLSTKEDFSQSLIDTGWHLFGGASNVVDEEVAEVDINDVPVSNILYLKVCFTDGSCTPVHKLKFHDDTVDGAPQCYGYYRAVDVEVIASSMTTLSQDIAGVIFQRNNQTQVCTLENTSDTAVHFIMEVPERALVVIQQVYMTPGAVNEVNCKSLREGDLVVVSAWIGFAESVINRLQDNPPDVMMEFVWSNASTIHPTRSARTQSVTLNIARTGGVDCSITTAYNGQTIQADATLACTNNSAENMEVYLYTLKEEVVQGETKWVRDYSVAHLSLDKSGDWGDAKDTVITSFATATYLLDVRTSGWWNNSNLRHIQPFQMYMDSAGLQIVNLGEDVYHEDTLPQD